MPNCVKASWRRLLAKRVIVGLLVVLTGSLGVAVRAGDVQQDLNLQQRLDQLFERPRADELILHPAPQAAPRPDKGKKPNAKQPGLKPDSPTDRR
jgi:hypothetical protein